MTMPPPHAVHAAHAERIIVWVPGGRDGALTTELLQRENVPTVVCADLEELCVLIEEGAAAALLTEETCSASMIERLRIVLLRQPAWSDFPIIMFSEPRGEDVNVRWDAMRALGNVTFLDRPVRVRSMVATVKAAVRSRKRQHEARRAIESRDQFLAMLGHELRNPLGAIRFAVELQNVAHDEPSIRRAHDVIDRQSTHLARLVDDLLDVARVTHGKVTLHCEPVDLCDIVQQCFQTLEPSARAHGVRYTLSKICPARVNGDRSRLEQVFSNLLTNALKYTPEGGEITVTLARPGAAAEVRVLDTGIGISSELLPRVFDVFAQADPSLDRSKGGMGLGLTVVQSIVRLHGGEVTARSEGLGRGSEFCVRLPLLIESRPVSPSGFPQSKRSAIKRKRVVLVEDSEDIRELMAELLREAGHDVIPAVDGPDGLSKIFSSHPDIAFVDIGLPGFDGFEVARRVRATDAHVQLVALTGYGQLEDRERAKEAGFMHHLTKPVGLAEIEALMSTL